MVSSSGAGWFLPDGDYCNMLGPTSYSERGAPAITMEKGKSQHLQPRFSCFWKVKSY
jgi:uncharacterized cupin superfamily protein